MPELPEVETIRRGLKDCILNKKIVQVEVCCEKSFVGEPVEVEGREIIGLRRRGKALLIDLSGGVTLLIHLRMTGQMIYVGEERFAGGHPNESFVGELPNKQTRVIIELSFASCGKSPLNPGTSYTGTPREPSYGRASRVRQEYTWQDSKVEKTFHKKQNLAHSYLYFNDQRKFGFIKVLPTDEVEKDAFIGGLGKEPWEMETEELYEKLQRHRAAPIKAVILDQKVMAGLGNIYADEALYAARIHPARRAGSLTKRETALLLESACAVMDKSLEAGGSTIQNYVKADGTRGNYLDLFAKVYHRDGEKCERCGETIVKTKVAGRGTHYCPECQRLEGDEND